jgi:NAD(P)H dehydrogenase (quinone)
MNIGITGATGHLGRFVVEALKGKRPSADIVALVRSPAKAAELGVEARKADYDNPETVDKALAGIDTLLLISANEVGRRAPQHRNVIASAKKAGVKHIVYTSLLHADTSTLSLADEHRATEAMLKESGVPLTILRNGWYTENYTGSIAGALASGAFLGAAGDAKISSATRADYADAAVAVLTTDGHAGKIYELAGDDAYTLGDLAAEISRQTGRTIPYRNLSEADYATALSGLGLPPPLASSIAGWDVAASQGALFDDSHQLSTLIGRPTTPLSSAVAEAIKRIG